MARLADIRIESSEGADSHSGGDGDDDDVDATAMCNNGNNDCR